MENMHQHLHDRMPSEPGKKNGWQAMDKTIQTTKIRRKRTVNRVISLLKRPPASYNAYEIKDDVFDVIAVKEGETMIMRVVVDEVSAEDERKVRSSDLPDGIKKKIIWKKYNSKELEEMTVR